MELESLYQLACSHPLQSSVTSILSEKQNNESFFFSSDLEFYGSVNTFNVMVSWSVSLLTHFLGKLSPLIS